MKAGSSSTSAERAKIAARIVELSEMVLSTQENPRYFALKVGTGPYSNAVTVRKNLDRVSFFIESTDLLNRTQAGGFTPVEAPQIRPMNKHKFYFPGLSLDKIEAHEALFREIIEESIRTVADRRRSKNW